MVTPLWLSPSFPQVCLSHDRHLHRHRLTPGGLSSRQAWGWHPHPGMASHGRGRHQNRQISAHHVQRLNVTGFSLSFSVVWQTGLPVCVGLRWFFAFFLFGLWSIFVMFCTSVEGERLGDSIGGGLFLPMEGCSPTIRATTGIPPKSQDWFTVAFGNQTIVEPLKTSIYGGFQLLCLTTGWERERIQGPPIILDDGHHGLVWISRIR